MRAKIGEKNEYAKWLDSQEWDFFCTFTTRYRLTLPSAKRAMERLHARTRSYGGSKLFWCAEPFDSKEGYHTHGLIRLHDRAHKENDADFGLIKESWRIASKGGQGKESNFTVLKRYNAKKGAGGYVSKYITKNRAEYDILL